MTDEKRKAHNTEMLDQVYVPMARIIRSMLIDMEDRGFRPRIGSAWRSEKEQLEKFRKHLSHVPWGFHCATKPDGSPEALAVDFIDEDFPVNMRLSFALCLLWAADAHGLTTGILFGLPGAYQALLIRHARMMDFAFPTKRIGWDAGHVEYPGLTEAEAKAGKRP